jgi:hypothetical protein
VDSFELTVPDVGFAATNSNQFLKIEAEDAQGQVGSDHTAIQISSGRITGALQVTTSFAGQTFHPGDTLPPITWTGSVSGLPLIEEMVILEADGVLYGTAANGGLPFVSTDAARVAVRVSNNSNDVEWFFANGTFSIRYDDRLGLQPPAVQLLTPAAGSSYGGGSVVPITWSASDDEGLYSFDIQASFNGGKTWHLITEQLAPEVRRFDWVLPSSTGIPDVRVRVIARDIRFQNTTSGADQVFRIGPG